MVLNYVSQESVVLIWFLNVLKILFVLMWFLNVLKVHCSDVVLKCVFVLIKF